MKVSLAFEWRKPVGLGKGSGYDTVIATVDCVKSDRE